MCVGLDIADNKGISTLICVILDITDKRGISTLICVGLDFAHNTSAGTLTCVGLDIADNKGISTWNCRYLNYQDVYLSILYTADNKGIRARISVRLENGDKDIRTSSGWWHPCILRTSHEYAWQLGVGKVFVHLDFETQ